MTAPGPEAIAGAGTAHFTSGVHTHSLSGAPEVGDLILGYIHLSIGNRTLVRINDDGGTDYRWWVQEDTGGAGDTIIYAGIAHNTLCGTNIRVQFNAGDSGTQVGHVTKTFRGGANTLVGTFNPASRNGANFNVSTDPLVSGDVAAITAGDGVIWAGCGTTTGSLTPDADFTTVLDDANNVVSYLLNATGSHGISIGTAGGEAGVLAIAAFDGASGFNISTGYRGDPWLGGRRTAFRELQASGLNLGHGSSRREYVRRSIDKLDADPAAVPLSLLTELQPAAAILVQMRRRRLAGLLRR